MNKEHFASEGLPYIQYGQIHKGEFTTVTDRVITYIDPIHCSKAEKARKGDVIVTDVSEDIKNIGKSIVWMGEDEVVTSQQCLIATPDYNKLDGAYLAYFFNSNNFLRQKRRFTYGSSIFHIYARDIEKCLIPLPPLEIQRAIVKFLSRLEEFFASKSCGLTSEIELRKSQLKFYIEDLKCLFPQWHYQQTNTRWAKIKQLDFKVIRYIPLKKLANLKLGRSFKVTQIQQSSTAKYPLYSAATENMGEVAKLDTYDYDGEFLTWTSRGYAGEVFYRNEKFSITNLAGLIENTSTDILSTKYLYAILKAVSKSYVNQCGGLPMLNVGVMEEIEIPIIPIELQEQIGDFIISLEKLINSSDCSLNKEIANREKQFKFYFDLLFKY